jgi:hypothetical protein
MPQFDGLGLTDAQQHLATVVFIVALGVLFAWSQWKGLRDKPPVAKNFAFTGQLTDLQPVRDLVNVAKELLAQVGRIADSLEEEAERRQRDRDGDDAVDRRNRGRKPPTTP